MLYRQTVLAYRVAPLPRGVLPARTNTRRQRFLFQLQNSGFAGTNYLCMSCFLIQSRQLYANIKRRHHAFGTVSVSESLTLLGNVLPRNLCSSQTNLNGKKSESNRDGKSKEANSPDHQPTNSDDVPASQKMTMFQKLRMYSANFLTGFKQLLIDVRTAAKTRRKLGLYQKVDVTRLTREEVRHLRQTRKDLVKTLPLATLFMVPFIGYAAPVLAATCFRAFQHWE